MVTRGRRASAGLGPNALDLATPKLPSTLTQRGGGAGGQANHVRHKTIKSLAPYTKAGDDWTFKGLSTQKHTHGIHLYPARMHPEIARRVILKYGNSRGVVFDPFMGSGGVLLESMLCGINAIGFDINPLAVLISRVKTTVFKKRSVKLIAETTNTILRDSAKVVGGGGESRRS